jgi:hypothetical protein
MKKVLCRSLVLALGMALVASAAFAKRGGGLDGYQRTMSLPQGVRDDNMRNGLMPATAALTTTELYAAKFDLGGGCNAQGWVKVDERDQLDQFWHVTDFLTENVGPDDSMKVLAGSQSLWCGAAAHPTDATCGYLTIPGYGNGWVQSFQTKNCIPVTGDLDVTFMIECDSEESYDATYLEYTVDCAPTYIGWTTLDGGFGVWDGKKDAQTHTASYPGVPASVKVRLRFEADGGWSDEDGLWDSLAGPVVIDNLQVEGLALEDFENAGPDPEVKGDETTADWEGYLIPGFGQHIALYSGLTLLQQDECDKDLSCQWAAIENSLETYACGGFPLQAAVPKGNGEGQSGYIWNSVESPTIPLIGSGSVVDFQFAVYFDMPLDNLVFYSFGASSVNAAGCVGPFRDFNFVYYGDTKSYGWANSSGGPATAMAIGGLVAGGTALKVRMGANDMCGVWCGVRGTGNCHSHAPLLDNVRVYRVDIFGPTFNNRDLENFQDTFPTDGTDSGTGRADAAVSWQADASVTNIPADSFTTICLDPITRFPAEVGGDPITGDRSGLAQDLALGAGRFTRGYALWTAVWIRSPV